MTGIIGGSSHLSLWRAEKRQGQAQPRLYFGAASQEDKQTVTAASASSAFDKYVATAVKRDMPAKAAAPETMTFREFMQRLDKPGQFDQLLTTSNRYLVRAIEHYGGKEITSLGRKYTDYSAFYNPWLPATLKDRSGVHGQHRVKKILLDKVKDISQRNGATWLLMIVGPNGSGKSILARHVMAAMENYSNTDAGALYDWSFVWKDTPKGMTLQPMTRDQFERMFKRKGSAGAGAIHPKDIRFELPCNMNRTPFFLLDRETRNQIIEDLKAEGKIPKDGNYDYFINHGRVDVVSERVKQALLKKYDGDLAKVLDEHVMVKRWRMSIQDGLGLTEISPGETPFADVVPITPDMDPKKIPKELQHIGLMKYGDHYPRASNGIVYMDDFAKTSSAYYTHLLGMIETGTISIQTSSRPKEHLNEPANLTIIATANPESIFEFIQQKPSLWKALSDRTVVIMQGHELEYGNEIQEYNKRLTEEREKGRIVTPGVGEALAQFVVSTRLAPVDASHTVYRNLMDEEIPSSQRETFQKALKKLDIHRKLLLYNNEPINPYTSRTAPHYITPEEEALLRKYVHVISDEHYPPDLGKTNFTQYEGSFGMDMRSVIRDMDKILKLKDRHPLTVLDVFEGLSDYIGTDEKKPPAFEAARDTRYSDQNGRSIIKFPKSRELLQSVELHFQRMFEEQVKEAVGVYKPREQHLATILTYLHHVKASRSAQGGEHTAIPEEYQNPKGSPAPNKKWMEETENIITESINRSTQEKREDFRFKLLFRWMDAGSPQDLSAIEKLFSSEFGLLKTADETKFSKHIDQFIKDIQYSIANPKGFDNERRANNNPERTWDFKRMDHALAILEKQGYPKETLPKLLAWAFEAPKKGQLISQVGDKRWRI